jgi:anti-anti-sigma factor
LGLASSPGETLQSGLIRVDARSTVDYVLDDRVQRPASAPPTTHQPLRCPTSDSTLTPPGDGQSNESQPIELGFDPAQTRGYAAVVSLHGEHDILTSERLIDALTPISGDILVDLTDCRFLDSTAITVLIVDSQMRVREGHRLELLVPPENRTISRTLEVSGVRDLLTLHTSRP